METLQRYDGNVHPELWVKQARTYCSLNQIYSTPDQLEFCKNMINTIIIKIPSVLKTFDELINALKADISFTVFKDTCKRKLQFLRYYSEKECGNTSKFIAEFRMLCFGAEINDIEELKQYLFQSVQSYYYCDREEYKKVTSMDELIRLFNIVVSSNFNLIKAGSIVYADNPALSYNVLWNILYDSYLPGSLINYGKGIFLQAKHMNHECGFLNAENSVCLSRQNDWIINQRDTSNIAKKEFVASQDIIYLQNRFNRRILRSQDVTCTINNENHQEVFTHDERIGGHDEWCIELVQ
ncbi:6555_t:CDS:2 [Funneliformis geosporum]|uniref:6555_t:CDS:1 n=1 Tax=Funneliformis geosporum TaxID=1117311 RepID=A0A9W4WT02_9GLOM|nr:6555_t:CDS:2 [Funneliformis geosporum]